MASQNFRGPHDEVQIKVQSLHSLDRTNQIAGHRELRRLLKTSNRTTIRTSYYRFASLLGTFSILRLAFASARFLISSLIFSIRLLVSGL